MTIIILLLLGEFFWKLIAMIGLVPDSVMFSRLIHKLSSSTEFNTIVQDDYLVNPYFSKSSEATPSSNANSQQRYSSKSLLFFSPDVHDGTMTDLSTSLTSLGHSIYFYNAKAQLPLYTGLRNVTLSEEQYLALTGIERRSRIIFAPRDVCKASKVFQFNMKQVNRVWDVFHNNTLFQQVDAIICMFYPSECQNYISFNKTVIFMPAHRFLIKRCSSEDWGSLLKWMFNEPKAPVIVMAAGKYDAEYINYYSGRNVHYIYASTVQLYTPPPVYSPLTDEFLFAPFKRTPFYDIFSPQIEGNCTLANFNCSVVNIRTKLNRMFTLADINQFKAVIVFPYAVLSYYLADIITTAIPMFVPSPTFIVQNKLAHDIKARDNHYCGKRFQEPPKHFQSHHPFSPEDTSEEATKYWLQYASYYTPCSIVFDDIPHLVNLLKETDYSKVYECNLKYRRHIINHNQREWKELVKNIDTHRVMPRSVNDSLSWYHETSFYN